MGTATYLEVIAPDPQLGVPERGVLFAADRIREPRLATWVLRSELIDATVAAASAAGIGIGAVESGSRQSPDGTLISWRLSDPYAVPLGGAVPFLISWGSTPHPAGAATRVGELVGLRIEHPEPEQVRKALSALGVEMDVRMGDRYQLIARIRTARRDVEIR